jgi:hypothetical protein
LLRYGDFQKRNPQNLMTLAWGIFISPKILSMKSGTEKKCQKEKKRKKKNTGSNWIQYLCGQRVGKFHSRSGHYNFKMLLYIFCWHCLPRQE